MMPLSTKAKNLPSAIWMRPISKPEDCAVTRHTGISALRRRPTAHVIRMVAPFTRELSQRHHHNVQFQLVYVLKGWFKSEFEGHGVHTMKEGSCWIQPPGIRHTVLGWSDDCEVLEIILPAEHETVDDSQPQ
jgi:quercetin dioxygenase-like cupin family protein